MQSFLQNSAWRGGALALSGDSKLILTEPVQINFVENHALTDGGAIFFEDPVSNSRCSGRSDQKNQIDCHTTGDFNVIQTQANLAENHTLTDGRATIFEETVFTSQCPERQIDCHIELNLIDSPTTESPSIWLDFVQNTADNAETVLYGGNLDNCSLYIGGGTKDSCGNRIGGRYNDVSPIDNILHLSNITSVDNRTSIIQIRYVCV